MCPSSAAELGLDAAIFFWFSVEVDFIYEFTSYKKRMEELSRAQLLNLMHKVGLRSVYLSGPYRQRFSAKKYSTMRTLSNPIEYFRKAMSIELEHGSINPGTDVTHNSLSKTAKIVAAHIYGVEHGKSPKGWRFFPGYYDMLIKGEKEASHYHTREVTGQV